MATVTPRDDFDPEVQAQALKDSMRGLGTDEDVIIEIMASHDNAQRIEIKDTFKTLFGQDLDAELASELGGNFENVVLAMTVTPDVFDARELRRSMKGAGTDEATLIEIMCTRTNDQIEAIKAAYEAEFERNLEEDLMGETSGYFKRLLVSQCNAGRDEDGDVDFELAREDAQKIYDAGEEQWGTDEAEIGSVLAIRSYAQLRATFVAYQTISERTLIEAIENECSGTLQQGYLAIVKCAVNQSLFFAERLHDAVSGLGTDDDTVIRIIVSRSETDLADIKDKFQGKFDISMEEYVESDCGGDYKRMLLAILKE